MPDYTTVAHTAIWLVQRLRGALHGSSTERIGPHVAQRGAAMAAAVVGTSVTDDPKDVSGSTDKEIEYVTHSTDKEFEYVKAKQFTSVKLFAKAGLGDKDLVTKTGQPYIARIEEEDDHDTEACEALFPVAWEGTRSIRMRELGEDGAAAQLDASSREVLLSTQKATASPDSNTPGGPDNAVFVADVEQGQAEEAPHRPPVLGDVVSGRRRGFNAERNTRMVDQLDQLTSAVGAAVGAETPTLHHDGNAQPYVDSPLASGDALEPDMWALRWTQYGTRCAQYATDWRFLLNKARRDKMKVLTVVYTAAAGRVATLRQNGQAWHGAAAACLATLAYAYLARRTRICITTAGCVALGCIILRSWQARHQLYRYLHDVHQDACNVMSLTDFFVISAEASLAFVHALFASGSDVGQAGTARGSEEQHTEAATVADYHAPIWRQIWRDFVNLQPKNFYKSLKTVFQPTLKEDKTKHGSNLLLDTSTSVDLETHGRNETASVTHPCNDGAISISSWQKREGHQVHRLPDDAQARQRKESAPLATTSTTSTVHPEATRIEPSRTR